MYALGKDTELAYHYDNAEITFNFCLGNTFSGAEVYFTHMTGVGFCFKSFLKLTHFLILII